MARLGGQPPSDAVVKAQELITEGRHGEAIEVLEAIVADYPEFEFALRTLGYLYQEQGRLIDAVRMLDRATIADPMVSQIKNSVYFRTQVAVKILNGEPPNGPNTTA